MELLVIGGSGLLGRELVRLAQLNSHRVTATYLTLPVDSRGVSWYPLDVCQVNDVMTLTEKLQVKAITPSAVIARTSLIIGNGDSLHETRVHALATGKSGTPLFTDDVRCPVHVSDLAAALLELGESRLAGVHHVAGTDAVSRHELGTLIARRDGLDASTLPSARRAETGPPGPLVVRLDCTQTQARLRTRLRGALEFTRVH